LGLKFVTISDEGSDAGAEAVNTPAS